MSLTRIGSIGINTGIAFAGVTTIVTLNTANDALSIGATVNVGSGITLGASGDIFATGVSTFSGNLKVGSGVTISPDGDGFYTGVVTATTFVGALTGNVTGNATGLSGTPNISAGTIAGSTGTFTGDVDIADKIVHTGDTNTAIRFPAADTFTVETGGSERARIDSSGNFLVRTTSLNNSSVDGQALQINGTTRPTLILRGNADDNQVAEIQFADNSGSDDANTGVRAGLIQYSHASNFMAFRTSASERLRIDSSGRLLLGTTTEGSAGADEFTINTASGHGGMTIRNDTSSNGNIWFSDGTSGAAEYAGYVQYAHSGDHMVFGTAGAEKVRISSAGNVGINQNNPQYLLHVTGTTSAARIACNDSSSGISALAVTNETNADLESVIFTNRSSLGSSVNIPISFHTNGKTNEKIRMHTTGELSVPSGVTLGLTASDNTASNTLDDYEEGTFTYTHASGGNVIVNSTGRSGFYIKIGRVVHVWGQFATDTTGNYAVGTNIRIHDLPFVTDSTNTPNAAGIITVNYTNSHQTTVGVVHISGTNELHGRVTATSGHSITGSGHYFQVSYVTAS